jgi:uncharacterized protein (DUF4213/DUF364 family)
MKISSISDDYRRIGEQIAILLGSPRVSGLYLPAPVADETFRDEFGFVFLANEGIGPFYVSMDNILPGLWQRYPKPELCDEDAISLLQGFASEDPSSRALALGTYNALSAKLYQAAGFEPPDRKSNSGLSDTPPGSLVGMVGYFCPLVDKLTAQGCEVLVLERAPERVPERLGVSVTSNPQDLAGCKHLLCTASTLINDSLEDFLAATEPTACIEIVGPSGSGLPDPLLARGVTSIGGISFGDRNQLIAHLRRGGSWGEAGRKYQLDKTSYPGLAQLIARLYHRA